MDKPQPQRLQSPGGHALPRSLATATPRGHVALALVCHRAARPWLLRLSSQTLNGERPCSRSDGQRAHSSSRNMLSGGLCWCQGCCLPFLVVWSFFPPPSRLLQGPAQAWARPAHSVTRARPLRVPAVPSCGVYIGVPHWAQKLAVLAAAPRCPLSLTPG